MGSQRVRLDMTEVTYRVCKHHAEQGFPGDSGGKQSACNAGNLGSIPGLGRSLREGPSSILVPGEFQGQRSLASYSPWGCRVGQDLWRWHIMIRKTRVMKKRPRRFFFYWRIIALQNELAIGIHIAPLSWTSFPPPSSSHSSISEQNDEMSSPCYRAAPH